MTNQDRISKLFGEQFLSEVQAVNDGTAPRVDPRFPDRPQHEDFWAMSEIARHNDSLVDEKHLDLEDILILAGIDPASLDYTARQRVARGMAAVQVFDPDAPRRLGHASFLDGFLIGYRLAQRNAPTLQQVLDESPDGQHRAQE